MSLISSPISSTFIQTPWTSLREAKAESSIDRASEKDRATFGSAGAPSTAESIKIANERMISKVKTMLAGVRAELGLPEDAELDTSPEATAGRIFDFAIAFFGAFRTQHQDLAEEDARLQYAQLIGGAMSQGIQEARQILGALGGLNDDVDNHISRTASILEQKLQDFVANGS